MTVCIAAIAEHSLVFAASDRMLTSGSIEYEPAQPKREDVSNAITILWAGDAAFQAEILSAVRRDVLDRIKKNKELWSLVSEVATLYQKYYLLAWRRCAETDILAPLDLDTKEFVRAVKDMPDFRWQYLTRAMAAHPPLGVWAIVAGCDPDGPHIYAIDNARVMCQDKIGFAAIGEGASHANSQMMFARHSPDRLGPETLFRVYSAKKHSEVAPGVGTATDLWFSALPLARSGKIDEKLVKELVTGYEIERKRQEEGAQADAERFTEAFKNIAKAQAVQQEPAIPEGPVATEKPTETNR